MRDLKNVIYGAIIGMANVIPGVSGGTMAVMLDVYDKILMALSLKNAKENARFLATLGIGCLIGIFAFSKVLPVAFLKVYTSLYSFQPMWASLVAQMVKNPPAMQEIPV